jgi:hypothetical protein
MSEITPKGVSVEKKGDKVRLTYQRPPLISVVVFVLFSAGGLMLAADDSESYPSRLFFGSISLGFFLFLVLLLRIKRIIELIPIPTKEESPFRETHTNERMLLSHWRRIITETRRYPAEKIKRIAVIPESEDFFELRVLYQDGHEETIASAIYGAEIARYLSKTLEKELLRAAHSER